MRDLGRRPSGIIHACGVAVSFDNPHRTMLLYTLCPDLSSNNFRSGKEFPDLKFLYVGVDLRVYPLKG